MRKRILLWLLPVVDVFALEKILAYYSSLGVTIPRRHAYYGMIERWVGYLPAGFVICWCVGFWAAFIIGFAVLAVVGPTEFYLMHAGIQPWGFFRKKSWGLVAKIFLLEGYNAVGYYLLGALLKIVIFR